MKWLQPTLDQAKYDLLADLRKKLAEVFDIAEPEIGVLYEGEFIPTGPVVEGTIDRVLEDGYISGR